MRAHLTPLALVPLLAALLVALLLPASPAYADGRVTVANDAGDARVDPAYATTLTVSGSGFQSVRGGHGGIYVFFGTVQQGWRPSQGGATGADYFYVPDSEARDNAGFQRFVAFPGSDTASSANGGTMSASGSWSTSLVVPGAVFQAFDRDGGSRRVDCRKVTCGVITVGAHGVANASNESFTPVTVSDLYADRPTPSATSVTPEPGAEPTGPAADLPTSTSVPSGPAAPRGPPVLEVDRTSAQAGHVLAFSASGLPAGAQVSAVLDDGVAGAGPFVVGSDGTVGGVVTLPMDVEGGTHELRLFGADDAPSVRFAITTDEATAPAATPTAVDGDRAGVLALAGSGLVLLVVIVRLLVLRRGGRSAH